MSRENVLRKQFGFAQKPLNGIREATQIVFPSYFLIDGEQKNARSFAQRGKKKKFCAKVIYKFVQTPEKCFTEIKEQQKLAFICFQTFKRSLIVFNLQIFLFIVNE